MKGGQEGGRTGGGKWNGWDVSIMAGSNILYEILPRHFRVFEGQKETPIV